MPSPNWPIVVFIVLYLSFCWASSDPYVYNNKSQYQVNESRNAFNFNLTDLIYGTDNQVL